MKVIKATWIGFIVTLSALNFPDRALATQSKPVEDRAFQSLESRLHKIAVTLKEREKQLDDGSIVKPPIEIAGWLKGRRGGFLNRRGGGGFLNRRRWTDRGGFYNYRRR